MSALDDSSSAQFRPQRLWAHRLCTISQDLWVRPAAHTLSGNRDEDRGVVNTGSSRCRHPASTSSVHSTGNRISSHGYLTLTERVAMWVGSLKRIWLCRSDLQEFATLTHCNKLQFMQTAPIGLWFTLRTWFTYPMCFRKIVKTIWLICEVPRPKTTIWPWETP